MRAGWPDRDGTHGGCRLAAEHRIDEGEPAEPAANLAARRRHGHLRLAGDLRVFRHPGRWWEVVSHELSRAPRRAAPPVAWRRNARHAADVAGRGHPAARA